MSWQLHLCFCSVFLGISSFEVATARWRGGYSGHRFLLRQREERRPGAPQVGSERGRSQKNHGRVGQLHDATANWPSRCGVLPARAPLQHVALGAETEEADDIDIKTEII